MRGALVCENEAIIAAGWDGCPFSFGERLQARVIWFEQGA